LLAVMSSLRVEAGLVGTALDESPAGVGRRSGVGWSARRLSVQTRWP